MLWGMNSLPGRIVPQFDPGRIKDLQMLESKLRNSTSAIQRGNIERAINAIKRQAEDPRLMEERTRLIQARKSATEAVGEINIENARKDGDKLEEKIHHTFGA